MHVMMTPIATARVRPGPPNEIYDGARHRVAPDCYVVRADLAVVMTTVGTGREATLPDVVAHFVAGLIEKAGGDLSAASGSEIVEGKLVRTAPMDGVDGPCLGVFVEVLRGRDALASAIERYGLSVRETDVLNCLARGERTKAMAKTLGISEATVSDHVKSIMSKMNCHSRTQLLARVFGPS
jgi:DNA-binding CsgD family transcriptional regulator